MHSGAVVQMKHRIRKMWSVLLGSVLIATAAPAANAQVPAPDPAGETIVNRFYETALDGTALKSAGQQYYEVNAADFSVAAPGGVGAAKPALPLPEVASGWDVGFEQECRDPANAAKSSSAEGWTKDHYRWCRGVTVNWDRLICGSGQCRLVAKILIQVVWLGYADAHNRKFHIWGKTLEVIEVEGEFDDDARVAAWADCAGTPGRSSCSARYQPDTRATLADIKAGRNNVFETVLTDTSIPNVGLTGEAVAPLEVYSWFTGAGGTLHPTDSLNTVSARVASRCDSVRLRSKQACTFNNVSAFLTYDKNDNAYPVSELVDHIRYAQDVLGAPGRWRNGAPDGPPLTRLRHAPTQNQNRARPKAQCRAANPGGWNGRVQQCDEYPFASTKEGGASGGPVSGKLIAARQNKEGGIQLNNWYQWDRIIDNDTFWVNLIG